MEEGRTLYDSLKTNKIKFPKPVILDFMEFQMSPFKLSFNRNIYYVKFKYN